MKAICEYRNIQVMPCTYWQKDSKTCANSKMFRCPEYIKEMGMGEDPLSHSSIQNYVSCRRKFYYSFFLGLKLKKEGMPLYVGSICHETMALLHRGTVYPDIRTLFIQKYTPNDAYEDQEMSNSVVAASALMQVYEESGLNKPKGHTEVQFLLEDPPLIGYVDMVDGDMGFEWKIASNADYYNKFSMEEQLCTYFSGLPDIGKMVVRVLVKPKLRRTAKESSEEYEERCKDDIRRKPGHYFNEETYYRNEFDVAGCIRKIKYIHSEIIRLLNSDDTIMESFYQNKGACWSPWACDYLSICQHHGVISEDLYTTRNKDEEKDDEG